MLSLRHPHILLMIGITSDRAMNHGIVIELMDMSLAALLEADPRGSGNGSRNGSRPELERQPSSSSPRGSPPRSSQPPGAEAGRLGGTALGMTYALGMPLEWVWPMCSIALDVARGMAYLHENQVLHRDLKPANVLLKLPSLVAKVADFGASRDASSESSMTMSMAGTPVFMAPEVLRQERYGKEADVWSYGGLLVHCATRSPPYKNLLQKQPAFALMQAVANYELSPLTHIETLEPDWTPEVAALAGQCCQGSQKERPPFVEIVEQMGAALEAARSSGNASSAPRSSSVGSRGCGSRLRMLSIGHGSSRRSKCSTEASSRPSNASKT